MIFKKILFRIIRNKNSSFNKKFTLKLIDKFKNLRNMTILKIKSKLFRFLINRNNNWALYYFWKTDVERYFLCHIIDKISYPNVILELGSRDAIQSIEFFRIFPHAKIFAFECNPPSIKKCIENVKYYKNIEVVPHAVGNKNEKLQFYPVTTDNIGASSLYKASGKYDFAEILPQKEITVEGIRIDTWAKEKGINKLDLCWLDLQGAEYEALEGMGDLIFSIQAIYLEVSHQEIYKGQKLFREILEFLKGKGFSMIQYHPSRRGWWGNAVFLNDNLKNMN